MHVLEGHISDVRSVLADSNRRDRAGVEIILDAYGQRRSRYVVGNGSSATTPRTSPATSPRPPSSTAGRAAGRPITTTSRSCRMANDTSYDRVFSSSLTNLLDPGDVVIANQRQRQFANVVSAVVAARLMPPARSPWSVFAGGRLLEQSMPRSTYPGNDYGVVPRTATRHRSTPSPSPPGRRCLPEARVPAVFLDRDGVIKSPPSDHVRPGTIRISSACSVRWLPCARLDTPVVVVTNRPWWVAVFSPPKSLLGSHHSCRRTRIRRWARRGDLRLPPRAGAELRLPQAGAHAPPAASVDLASREKSHGGRRPERRSRRRAPPDARPVLISDGESAADPDILAVKDLPTAVTLWPIFSMVGARPCDRLAPRSASASPGAGNRTSRPIYAKSTAARREHDDRQILLRI